VIWLVETLLAVSLLLLLVLLVRDAVARLFGAGWAYALWLLPALRLVLPPLDLLAAEIPSILPSAIALIPAAGGAAAPLPLSGGPGQWVPLMLATWAGGAAVFMLRQWLGYRAFVREVHARSRASMQPRFKGIAILESEAVDGPVAIGLTDRRIVVPGDFLQRYSASERRLALEHECVHHRRGDIWWNSLALGMLALNWFNPLAYIAFRAFRMDQELSCDAAVAAGCGPGDRHDYARALIKSASRPGLVAACPLNHAHQLKRRLKMMKAHRVSKYRSIGGSTALAGLVVAGLGLSAPGFAQEQGSQSAARKMIITMVGKDGKEVTLDAKGLAQFISNCPGAQKLQERVAQGGAGKPGEPEVLVCAKDGKAPNPEMRERLSAALERARGGAGPMSSLTPERREQVLAALKRELDKMGAQVKK